MNVIVDEVVLDEEAWRQWEAELGDIDPFWVRVDCPMEVCEERERARPERLPGLARAQAPFVHATPGSSTPSTPPPPPPPSWRQR